jgi:hypothetical protein
MTRPPRTATTPADQKSLHRARKIHGLNDAGEWLFASRPIKQALNSTGGFASKTAGKNSGAISIAYGYGLEPAIPGRAAVNLAAFTSAFGSLVAADRGFCSLNGLSRSCYVLFGLEFSAVRMKEHDA